MNSVLSPTASRVDQTLRPGITRGRDFAPADGVGATSVAIVNDAFVRRYLADGEYVKDSGRATRGLDRFAIRRDGDTIVVNLDRLYQQNEDQAQWTAAFITL